MDQMKAMRTISVRLLASLGLVLVVAMAWQRLGQRGPAQGVADRVTVATSQPASRPAMAPRDGARGGREADGGTAPDNFLSPRIVCPDGFDPVRTGRGSTGRDTCKSE